MELQKAFSLIAVCLSCGQPGGHITLDVYKDAPGTDNVIGSLHIECTRAECKNRGGIAVESTNGAQRIDTHVP